MFFRGDNFFLVEIQNDMTYKIIQNFNYSEVEINVLVMVEKNGSNLTMLKCMYDIIHIISSSA